MPRYNGATFKQSPNRWNGRQSQPVRAVCLHVTAGPVGNEYASALSWLCNPTSQVSAHFLTSPTGDIAQLVDTFDTAWANGISYSGGHWSNVRGKVVNPTWQLIQPPTNPNFQTISIENAGQSGKPISAAQMAALLAVLRWLGTIYPQLLPYVPGKTLIRHADIDPVDKPFCPGAAFDLNAIALAANGGGLYIYRGLRVWQKADRKGDPILHLPDGVQLEIDAIDAAPDYAPGTGHVKRAVYTDAQGQHTVDAPGFVAMGDLG